MTGFVVWSLFGMLRVRSFSNNRLSVTHDTLYLPEPEPSRSLFSALQQVSGSVIRFLVPQFTLFFVFFSPPSRISLGLYFGFDVPLHTIQSLVGSGRRAQIKKRWSPACLGFCLWVDNFSDRLF
ncbi:hypothetical protein BJY04DRAFT_191822 [Aspergillus karnatakaensis]|uniref:uncharacterized protein n=1 Tax=Aspergillus karnatakaensis TaxID=1810916 RepID=UPI003CCD98F9